MYGRKKAIRRAKGLARYIAVEDKKLTEKLPNELRSLVSGSLDSHHTFFIDSYCKLYATDKEY